MSSIRQYHRQVPVAKYTVFITKWWDTRGILKVIADVDGTRAIVKGPSPYVFENLEWYFTLKEARNRVRDLALFKRGRLTREIRDVDTQETTALDGDIQVFVPET